MSTFKVGDRLQVRPEFDIPEIFRPDGKPTAGTVDQITGKTLFLRVPIGDEDPEVHSQAVPYETYQLVREDAA
jgi:hypothetical protein